MSFDQSRSASNPWASWRDFLGVVMQQGRVQLDSDWNEWLAEIARRLQAGTLDLIGCSGVPATTPNGFKIFANAGTPPQVGIGAGRIYVDGILAENHGPSNQAQWDPSLAEWSGAPQPPGSTPLVLDFTQQPYIPGASVPGTKDLFLVYLDIWQREITYLECPGLIDPAVGVDTTGRMQTVWQVKFLDVAVTSGGPQTGVTCATPDASISKWASQIQPSSSQLTTVQGGSTSGSACSLASGSGFTGLENQLYRVHVFQGGTALSGPPGPGLPVPGTATFVWSRENASVATAVNTIAGVTNSANNAASQLAVNSLGRDQVLGFKVGDWVEVIADYLELNGKPGELHQIDSISSADKTITLDSTLTAGNFPPGQTTGNTRVRRWDQSGTVFLSDGVTVWTDLNASITPGVSTGSVGIPVPPPNVALLLENGVAVSFGPLGNTFAAGEFWTITTRTADGSIETLNNAPPAGIRHHYCRLAVVDLSASPPIVKDCRRVFPSLANPAIHVSQVLLGSASLANGSLVSIQDLLKNGLTINFDNPLDPAIIPPIGSGSPIATISVDLPTTNPPGGGFSPLVLGATVKIGPSPNTLVWATTASAAVQTALQNLFPAGTPFVARLALKGSLIWAHGQPRIYLNGASDGRPSGDFVMWFWLSSQPPTTLSTTNLIFATPQLVGTPVSQTLTFTNNNPTAAISITGITFAGANAADFTETNSLGATFPLTLQGGQACTITVTFKPSAPGTRTAQMNIADSADSVVQVVSLSGTGVQPAISVSPLSLNFASAVVGSVSASQPVTVTNIGSSQLTISGITIQNPNFVPSGSCFGAGGTLQPNQACTINVQFVPVAAGNQTGTLVINNNAATQQVTVSGTALPSVPGLTASSNALNFGTVALGASPTLNLVITSSGTAPLTIIGASVSGAGYSLTSNTCTTLQPGAQCTLTLKFAPPSAATFNGTLTVTHNAPGSPLVVSLSGAGVGVPGVSPSATSLNFGSVVIDGSSSSRSVTLTSTGTAPLTIGATSLSGVFASLFSVSSNTCTGNLAPGATCTVNLNFTPTTIGAKSATLTIATNAGNVAVTLTGSGLKKPVKEDGDGKGSAVRGIIAHLTPVENLRMNPLVRGEVLPDPAGPVEEGPIAEAQAFIRPEERPPVGVEMPAEPEESAKTEEPPKEG